MPVVQIHPTVMYSPRPPTAPIQQDRTEAHRRGSKRMSRTSRPWVPVVQAASASPMLARR